MELLQSPCSPVSGPYRSGWDVPSKLAGYMIQALLSDAIRKSIEAAGFEQPANITLERPARKGHGDWSTNVALTTAKSAGKPPRDIANAIAGHLNEDPPTHVLSVEVAGPGFINFHLDPKWLHEVLHSVITERDSYGSNESGKGQRVICEFVSANPTGPMTIANAWWSSYGDALARVLERNGWVVHREYYVNDTGNQIRTLGGSVLAVRRGEEPPEGSYRGEYISELAARYDGSDDVVEAGRWAAEQVLKLIRTSLDLVNIHFDEWFSQASIEDSGAVAEAIDYLRSKGMVYEQDGATWVRTTDFGDQRDRVLKKSDDKGGDYTYFAGDIAYHYNKLVIRGFDHAIDVFGADHHGQVASLLAGVDALGIGRGKLEIKLGQMVSFTGAKMSKRSGNFVTLDDVVAEIGPDATRLLSLVNSIDQPTNVDLELIRKNSSDNPVFYVQYAHARISSIFRKAEEKGVQRPAFEDVDFSVLTHERELDLLRSLEELPDVIRSAAELRAPHRVTTWALDFASRFHGFYHDCRVLGIDVTPESTNARLWLTDACRTGFAIALSLLGVRAPEKMSRLTEEVADE